MHSKIRQIRARARALRGAAAAWLILALVGTPIWAQDSVTYFTGTVSVSGAVVIAAPEGFTPNPFTAPVSGSGGATLQVNSSLLSASPFTGTLTLTGVSVTASVPELTGPPACQCFSPAETQTEPSPASSGSVSGTGSDSSPTFNLPPPTSGTIESESASISVAPVTGIVTLTINEHVELSASGITGNFDYVYSLTGTATNSSTNPTNPTNPTNSTNPTNPTNPTSPFNPVVFVYVPLYKSSGASCDVPGGCSVGNPVSLGTGNKYETVTDFATAGANPLAFTRYYNSLADTNTFATTMGQNWRAIYDRYLRISTNVIAERADGQELLFTINNSSATVTNWTSDSDVDMQLVESGTTWTLVDGEDNVETYFSDGLGEGFLSSLQARNGYTQYLEYNGELHLQTVSDSFNRMLHFAYGAGLLRSVTGSDGTTVTFRHDSSGRLVSVTYPTSPPTHQEYLYDDASFPFAMTDLVDENGNLFASWSYDATGRAISSQHAGGADLTTITYNDSDGSRVVTNSLGQATVYRFTTLQGSPKLTEIDRLATASVSAASIFLTYDANGYPAISSDWNSNLTTSINDPRGLPLVVSEAVGSAQERSVTNTYLTNYHLPTQIVGPGKTTDFVYDANGNVLTRTETDTGMQSIPYPTSGQTRAWTYTYDSLGHVLTANGPRTNVAQTITFTYNGNNPTTITDPLGHLTKFNSYSKRGLPLSSADPNGTVTTFTYEPRGWLVSRTVQGSGGNATTKFAYTPSGQISSVTLPDGSKLNYAYDTAQRLVSARNLLHESINYTLDANGDATEQDTRNAASVVVKTGAATFDNLGRMLQQIGAYSETTSYAYDGNGNRILIADGLNNTNLQTFDTLNRLVTAIDPLNNVAEYAYDTQDNLTALTDPRSLATTYVYDGFGRVIQESSPDKGTTVYVLDQAGNRVSQTDARGVVTERTFDPLNRVTAETFPSSGTENMSFTYDTETHANKGIGRLTSYMDETGSTMLTYNGRGDVTGVVYTIGSATYSTVYAYNVADRIMRITYPSGHSVVYTRDNQGRITSVAFHDRNQMTMLASKISYLPFGPVSSFRTGNKLQLTRGYDLDYRLTGITTEGVTGTVQNLIFGYDAVNDISSITDNVSGTNSQTFEYDQDYRLTNASGVYGTLQYSYDQNGNRLSMSGMDGSDVYGYASLSNALETAVNHAVTRQFTYAPDGNTISDNRGGATALTFGYGARDRYNTLLSGGATIASYSYNALGQRAVKTVSGDATQYHYDLKGHLIAESSSSGLVTIEYVWLDDLPLAEIVNGTVYYIHGDQLGTPQTMTDRDQNVAWSRVQDPFGQTVSIASTENIPNNLRFPGQYLDAESGLNYNMMRDYDPTLGRYIQSDPIGERGGFNLYAYVGNNPNNRQDPSGLIYMDNDLSKNQNFGKCSIKAGITPQDAALNEAVVMAIIRDESQVIGGLALGAAIVLGPEDYPALALAVGKNPETFERILTVGDELTGKIFGVEGPPPADFPGQVLAIGSYVIEKLIEANSEQSTDLLPKPVPTWNPSPGATWNSSVATPTWNAAPQPPQMLKWSTTSDVPH